MIVLGIDPGTRRVGYGAIKKHGGAFTLLGTGLLNIRAKSDAGALCEIKTEVDALVRKFKPSLVAIERLFFSKNQKTGMQVAEARGVIILAAAERGLRIVEYAPNEVKAGLTGYGLADKKAVLKMVRLALHEPGLEVIDDASDALAIAILAGQKGALDTRA